MTDPTTATSGQPAAASGTIPRLTREVTQQLAPQLVGRVVDAAAGRAAETVDRMTSRLQTVAAHPESGGGLVSALTGKPSRSEDTDDYTNGGGVASDGAEASPSLRQRLGLWMSVLLDKAIQLWTLIKNWAQRALQVITQRFGKNDSADDAEGDTSGDDAESDSADQDDDLDPDEDQDQDRA